jgi:LacI family transcriptional regulator
MKSSFGENQITIQDVAHRASTSITTVSRVINNSQHKVKAETRQRVLSAIDDLNYQPNTLARGLSTKQTQTVGVIIPDISNPYYAEIVRGIQNVAEERGYSITLQNTDRRQYRIINDIRMLRSKMVDGIIFSGGNLNGRGQAPASVIKKLDVRVVVVGRHRGGFPAVLVNNILSAQEAIRHLVDLGHKRIGHIGGPPRSTTAQDRLKGYKKGLAEAGIKFEKQLVIRGNLTPQSGFAAAREILSLKKNRPTAIFAANDLMAFGAASAAKELGLKIPGDLALVGFDNVPLSPYYDPPLTTVAIPMYNLGSASMGMIVDIVSGRPHEPQIVLETKLIIRASTDGSPKKTHRRCNHE